jgi:hypothetical protein
MSKQERRPESKPSDKSQHGDPMPAPDEEPMRTEDIRAKSYLPGEAARQLPTTTGKIGHIRKCGWCGTELAMSAIACPQCAPGAKLEVGGRNMR